MKRESLVKLPGELIRSSALTGSSPEHDAHAGTSTARYVLGIDGGATKTLAAVLDLESGQISLGHGGPSNQDAVGVKAAGEALFDAADAALAGLGIEDSQLDAAVLAVAGTDTEAVVRHVHENRSRDWVVVGDVVGAWATATAAEPGVGVISGTGSNVFGIGRDARTWRAGGWGHVLGDEGSGYWIGLQSIKAALADRESSGPATALSDAVCDFFHAESVEQAATLVYSKPLGKSEIAAFTVRAAELARSGDEVARELFRSGARVLGRQVSAVIERTELDGSFPVGLIGSTFKAGDLLIDPLIDVVHERAPRARVAVVEMAPVGGSLLLAAGLGDARERLEGVDLAGLIDRALAHDR